MNRFLLLSFVFVLGWGCIGNSGTEKKQNNRNNVLNVKENIQGIYFEDIYFSAFIRPYVSRDYLFLVDGRSMDKMIHVFDKQNFGHLVSTAPKGRGPGEIVSISHLEIDENRRRIYVTDLGKYNIFNYSLDSLVANPWYMPEVKMSIPTNKIPQKYALLNDSLAIGIVLEPIGNSDFQQFTGKWNMNDGEITLMPYRHPDIKKKRIDVAVSAEYGIFVEGYTHHDLMSIYDLYGYLKYNVYGKAWDTKVSNKKVYYQRIEICGNKIVALFSGKDRVLNDRQVLASNFMIFDLDGNYECTLDTGYPISYFCYDKEYNRIIMTLDDEMQVAYLDLNGLIDSEAI